MPIPSALAENVVQAVNKAPLLQQNHTKTLDAGYNGRTVSCGGVGDVSLKVDQLGFPPLPTIRVLRS